MVIFLRLKLNCDGVAPSGKTNEPALLDESLLVVQLGELLPDRVDQLDLSSSKADQHRDDALAPGGRVGGGDDGTKVVARRTRTLFCTKFRIKMDNGAFVRA